MDRIDVVRKTIGSLESEGFTRAQAGRRYLNMCYLRLELAGIGSKEEQKIYDDINILYQVLNEERRVTGKSIKD